MVWARWRILPLAWDDAKRGGEFPTPFLCDWFGPEGQAQGAEWQIRHSAQQRKRGGKFARPLGRPVGVRWVLVLVLSRPWPTLPKLRVWGSGPNKGLEAKPKILAQK